MKKHNIDTVAQKVGVPIKELSAKTIVYIKNAPQAQKRTAKSKKAVYVVDDKVYKGPYAVDDHKLLKNLSYTFALHVLEDVLKLPEWRRGALPWEYIGFCSENQCYLVAPNVGKTKNIPFDLVTSKIETDVPVIPRGGVIWRVSEAEKNGQLTEDIKLAALQHLYLRFLLDIGDSGTHNILIRQDSNVSDRLVAGIDLEEQRKKAEKNTRLNHLFKRPNGPSKLQEQLYKSYVDKIITLNDGQLDQSISDQLSAVGIDLERLKTNISLWRSLRPY